jgi:hypothetical protein
MRQKSLSAEETRLMLSREGWRHLPHEMSDLRKVRVRMPDEAKLILRNAKTVRVPKALR